MSDTPDVPQYNPAQAEQSARRAAELTALMSQYNYIDPYGSVTWTGDVLPGGAGTQQAGGGLGGGFGGLLGRWGQQPQQPIGTGDPRTMRVGLSPFGQRQLSLAESLLGQAETGVGGDAARRAEEAVYGQYTARMQPEFEERRQGLHNQLINQGIPVGSEAYSRAMDDLDLRQTDARQQALRSSVLTGQQSQAQQLQNLMSLFGTLGRPQMPSYQPGIGATQFPNLYDQQYNAAMQRYGVQAQQQGSMFGALGALGGGLLGGVGTALGKKIF